MCRETPSTTNEEKKECSDNEREIWETMMPMAWHKSVADPKSIFCESYMHTRKQILEAARIHGSDVIIEVGCGTGDVIGELDTTVQCYGLDINPMFIDFCNENHPHDHCEFQIGDACRLTDWWESFNGKYKKPLVVCVNNTLNIMPEEIRGHVVAQMIAVAGEEGHCLVSYWNGNFFSHAIMNYYKTNPTLCGPFELSDVDWEEHKLLTPSGYSTHWQLPVDVQKLLRAHDVNLDTISENKALHGLDHICTEGICIFAWFSHRCTTHAKGYYDSDDAQKFYNSIWGNETVHIGRYDLLTNEETASMSKQEQITRAQHLHEDEFMKLIRTKFPGQQKIRILDMGCGFGGLLRRLWKADMVWSGVGVDIASKMCEQNRQINVQYECDQDITVLEESYLDVSVADESIDLVISMDALLHVGPEGQRKAMQEAARVLRPGGWMIFTDIQQQEVVDAKEMQPIYDRIHLSQLGTVSNYEDAMKSVGFTNFEFDAHSSNVPAHYGAVREVLIEKGTSIGISEEYASKMAAGLSAWRELGPKNIVWGFATAQKTKKVHL